MDARTLTDQAAALKTQVQAEISSLEMWNHLMDKRAENDPSFNGWPTGKTLADHRKGTAKLFSRLSCVAATADAVALLHHAAMSLPDETAAFDEPPHMTAGFLYLEQALISDGDVVQMLIWFGLYDDEHVPIFLISTLSPAGAMGTKHWRIKPGSTFASLYAAIAPEIGSRDGALYDLRCVIAFNLLLQQGVTEMVTSQPSRPFRRRAERLGQVIDPVSIIRLPRRIYVASNGEGHRDWSHRWVVTGHWRNQWYPRTEVHRPKWIAPYVKGPDTLPLVIKDKRYLFDP